MVKYCLNLFTVKIREGRRMKGKEKEEESGGERGEEHANKIIK